MEQSGSLEVLHEEVWRCYRTLSPFASKRHSSLFTVDLLWHLLGRIVYLAKFGALSTIYAEATTTEAERILRRFNFEPVPHRSHSGDPLFECRLTSEVISQWQKLYSQRSFAQPAASSSAGSCLEETHMSTVDDFIIRRMKEQDIEHAAEVHAAAFPRQTFSKEWIQCGFRSFPIVELEQIAVQRWLHGQGIGTALIQQSLPSVAAKITERGTSLKHLLVNTRADNYAQRLYTKAMGAVLAATISGMFPVDEVYMIAKDVDIGPSAKSFSPASVPPASGRTREDLVSNIGILCVEDHSH